MAYNTNDVQFVEFEEAQELWRAGMSPCYSLIILLLIIISEMRSRRLRVRLASAIKENIRELAMGPRRSGKDTGRLESLEQSQTEPPKFAGLDMMFAPAGTFDFSHIPFRPNLNLAWSAFVQVPWQCRSTSPSVTHALSSGCSLRLLSLLWAMTSSMMTRSLRTSPTTT